MLRQYIASTSQNDSGSEAITGKENEQTSHTGSSLFDDDWLLIVIIFSALLCCGVGAVGILWVYNRGTKHEIELMQEQIASIELKKTNIIKKDDVNDNEHIASPHNVQVNLDSDHGESPTDARFLSVSEQPSSNINPVLSHLSMNGVERINSVSTKGEYDDDEDEGTEGSDHDKESSDELDEMYIETVNTPTPINDMNINVTPSDLPNLPKSDRNLKE